ncbi:LacI family DNA-binding transcriptional regulator [Jiangella mangrovi]|uniref:LacI family transcriptional regulator n=1 Tax=Jiangella mangrovi TaxID=1524084 RepID=A0A7W9LKD3_9ACTN|nr:LacI family DNA-binding transcriptional regulator [Jiangella mangrovi]MBB5787060.1 LacI family transcriptional regulator [Jiangella mangrovi]
MTERPADGKANRPPDIHAVARHAGVSHQTVSRVLNESPRVRPATRERVREAMRVLGYSPNVAARTLITRRSRTLGLVVLNEELYGPASALRHVEQDSRSAGYGLRILNLPPMARSTLREAVESLRQQLVDAVIVVDPHPEDQPLLGPLPSDLPLVTVGGLRSTGVPSVSYDSGPGVSQAVNYLLSLGHRTVHHIAGPAGWAEADIRRTVWEQTLRKAGREVPPPVEGDWTARSGYAAGLALAGRDDVTAVFSANDQMALGLFHALAERGITSPEDVSVVGFDDVPDAAYYRPALTTLRQDFAELGRHTVRLALRQIESGTREGVESVTLAPPSLILRASTAPPPSN